MPRGDQRGPAGRGAMTGRALGYCAGNDRPGYAADAGVQGAGRGLRNGAGRGPGFGRGCGGGRGRRIRNSFAVDREAGAYYRPAAVNNDNEEIQKNEVNRLENLVSTLADELKAVKEQLNNLKK